MTIAIVLGLSTAAFAEYGGGGMFQRGETNETTSGWMNRDGSPLLPNHGLSTNQNAPLGSGIALMMGLGAAYLVGKKRKED